MRLSCFDVRRQLCVRCTERWVVDLLFGNVNEELKDNKTVDVCGRVTYYLSLISKIADICKTGKNQLSSCISISEYTVQRCLGDASLVVGRETIVFDHVT